MAKISGRQHEIPAPKPRKPRALRRARRCWMLLAENIDGAVFLERRPERGIWGGLWCLPEFDSESACLNYARDHFLSQQSRDVEPLQSLHHAFTHFDLEIFPMRTTGCTSSSVMESQQSLWYNARHPDNAARVGLPAPIKLLLDGLTAGHS